MYEIGFLWSLYIVLVLGVFNFLYSSRFGCMELSAAAAFFWATIIGLIFVLIWYFYINKNNLTSSSKNWLTALLVVSIVLPILGLLWWLISWAWRKSCNKKPACAPVAVACAPVEESSNPCDRPKVIRKMGEEEVPVTHYEKREYFVKEPIQCPDEKKM